MRTAAAIALVLLLTVAPRARAEVREPAPASEPPVATAIVVKATLRAKPKANAPGVGALRRGETMRVLRSTADGKWLLLDAKAKGRDGAWVNARAVSVATPPPATPFTARTRGPVADPTAAARPVPVVAVAAPAPADVTPAAAARGPASEATAAGDLTPIDAVPDRDVGPAAERPPAAAGPLRLSVDGGLALLRQSFHSNGDVKPGRLDDYDFASEGVAAHVAAGYLWPLGTVFRLGVVGEYQVAGGTGVNAPVYAADGTRSNVRLSLQSHEAAVALASGAHANALGGVDVELHVGPALLANLVSADARAPLPSDRTIGLRTGVAVALPSLARAANRPVGVVVDAAYVGLLAQHAQTPNLEDGQSGRSHALMAGIELGYGLFASGARTQLSAFVAYRGVLQDSRYTGPSVRNDATNGNASSAERRQETHVASVGLRLAY